MKTAVAFAFALTLGFTGLVAGQAEARHRMAKPDLIMSAVSSPSSASSGETVVVSSTVNNQGTASAQSFYVAHYLSSSPSSTTGATVLGTQQVTSLAAGASVALVTSVTVPASTTSGTRYVVAVADATSHIKESNESNNTRTSGAIAVQDVTPPTISGVTTSGITASSATLTWKTNEASTSQVEYGLTTAHGSLSAVNTAMVNSHSLTLSGLSAGTLYHVSVRSTDAAGNTALSADYTFTTTTALPATTGTLYYVATTGSDGNPGTDASPFRTISRGVSVLTPGDTLYVKSGTYAEALVNNIPKGTSWSQPVTVAAYPGHSVTLRPNSGSVVLKFSGPQQYIVIDGLILDGTNLADDTDVVEVVSAAHHIRIQQSEVKNSQGNGLYVRSSSANEFIDLDIHHNGRDALDHGIYVATDAKGNLFEQSLVYSNAGWGIHLYHANGGVANNIIRSNQVYDHAERGIFVSSGTGNRIYNNVVWGNAKEGILVGQYGSPVQDTGIYNNTLYANGHGMTVGSNSSGTVLRNNLVYQSGGISNSGTGTVSDHNLVGLDPRFVNAAGGDFHLQAGSPAIDTGVTVSAVTTDFDDIPRPQGAAYNIGAFE